jgi:hypothetical protein
MFGLRLLVLGLLVAGASARAAAGEPEAARQQAKALRDQGASAAQAHDFVVALDCFERAYAIYPSANLLFNIGVALDRLQRSERAVAAFEEFLAGASTDVPASARDFARERLRALEPKVARLTLTVEPARAAVQLDGAPLYAPLSRPIPIAPGEHTLVATLEGHRPARTRLNLSPGTAEQKTLRLQPEPPVAPIATAPSPPVVGAPPATNALVAAPSPATTRRLRYAGIGVVSFGVAALAVAAGLTVNTVQLADAANHPKPDTVFDPSILDRGRTSQALETSFYAVGGAAAVSGVTLLIVAARRNHHAR